MGERDARRQGSIHQGDTCGGKKFTSVAELDDLHLCLFHAHVDFVVIGLEQGMLLGHSQVHLIGLFLSKEGLHCSMVGQVQLVVSAGDDLFGLHTMGQKMAHDGQADHSAMAWKVDFGLLAQLIGSAIGVFKTNDVVFAQITTRLHFDNF